MQNHSIGNATCLPEEDEVGLDIGNLVGKGKISKELRSDPTCLFENSDVLIDFTVPEATMFHAKTCYEKNIPIVIGTTGLDYKQEKELLTLSKKIPIVYSANFSIGVTLLSSLVAEATKSLGKEWDIEILEMHHKHKVDAPSGTALALGKAAAKGRGVALDDVADMVRKGQIGARKSGDIGFAVLRGGDVAGEHSVIFYGDAERVEISHRATDRAIFARGAIRAARFAATASSGFYDMTDVLKG